MTADFSWTPKRKSLQLLVNYFYIQTLYLKSLPIRYDNRSSHVTLEIGSRTGENPCIVIAAKIRAKSITKAYKKRTVFVRISDVAILIRNFRESLCQETSFFLLLAWMAAEILLTSLRLYWIIMFSYKEVFKYILSQFLTRFSERIFETLTPIAETAEAATKLSKVEKKHSRIDSKSKSSLLIFTTKFGKLSHLDLLEGDKYSCFMKKSINDSMTF